MFEMMFRSACVPTWIPIPVEVMRVLAMVMFCACAILNPTE